MTLRFFFSALPWCLAVLSGLVGSLMAQEAPVINSASIRAHFDGLSDQDMERLRSQRVLFLSRSFGLNLFKGLAHVAKEDPRYAFLDRHQRFNVFGSGGDLSIIPADVFEQTRIVHVLATYWPHTKRLEEASALLRQAPHAFAARRQVDVVLVYFHTASPASFPAYADLVDGVREEFPDLTVMVATAAFMGEVKAKDNAKAHAFSELVRQRYGGVLPIYDVGAILSDDFRVGHAYCPEYSKDPAGVHPNLPAGESMMAKGFLLSLKAALAHRGTTGKPAAAVETDAAAPVETLPDDHPQMQAVRAILDANGLHDKQAASVAVVENGQIVELYLQEGGIVRITDHIAALPKLRLLHCYGDPALGHPLLQEVSPALGRCRELRELLLNDNALEDLPVELTELTALTAFSVGNNPLTRLGAAQRVWLEQLEPAAVPKK